MKLLRIQLVLGSVLLFTPFITFAQNVNDIPSLFNRVMNILNLVVVPVIFAIAFALFIFKIYQYFIAGGGDEEKVKEGQRFLMWGIIGFAVMFSIWGLINLLVNSFGFDNATRPDIPTFGFSQSGAPSFTFPTYGGNSSYSGGGYGSGNQGSNVGSGNTGNVGSVQNGNYIPPTGYSGGGVVNGVQQAGNSSSFLGSLFGGSSSGSNPFTSFWNNLTSSGGGQSSQTKGLGQVLEGGICSDDGDCQGALICTSGRCAIDPAQDNVGFGKGNGQVQMGGYCQTNNDCYGESTCNYGICGAASGLESVGGPCVNDNECSGSLYCASSGTCQVDPSLDTNGGNGSNTTCDDGTVVPPGLSCSSCADGSTTADTNLCPVSASVQCSDGSYVPDPSLCPVAASVQCSDGSYADTPSQCPGG